MDFIFLSKLLPLFIYPLGLSCILLLVSLIIWWKRPAWTPIPLTLAFLILFISSNSVTSNAILRSLEWHYSYQENLPKADAIIILGGGRRSNLFPNLSDNLSNQEDRIFYGAKLFHQKKAPLIIVTGGRIKWLGGDISEAQEMADILIKMDVPSNAILKENFAVNTYENAINVKPILQKFNINKVLLVTSAIHIPRSMMIFRKQNINVIPAPTDFLVSKKSHFFDSSFEVQIISFLPNSESLTRTTKAIKEYVGIFIYWLKGWL